MNTHKKKPRINKQDRQKITFAGSAYPKEISQQCTPATHTQKQCTARGSSWGSSILISDHRRLPDPPGGGTGDGRQTSHQPTDASTPETELGERCELYRVTVIWQ